ncbi:MAG: GTP cyclohydrolase MptA [Candidatus Methanomethylophilaceae archaeon]|jgi:GTP cyclohydrolase-4
MNLKCDVQYGKTDSEFRLTRVGVTGVKKPVMVRRKGEKNELNKSLNCNIDIFVDLPAEQKGSHMSRNVEVLTDVVSESLNEPVSGLENMAADMCRKLLDHHEYSQTANVSISADYFRPRKTPNGRDTYEVYRLTAEAEAVRGKGVRKTIGAEAIGMTACPCAQQTVTEILGCSGETTVISHNQRNVCSASITMDEDFEVEADVLIDIIEESFSSPTFELLKREDEGRVVINAHTNPKFVEDVVRGVLSRIVDNFTELPDNSAVVVRSESEESIHKHNAFAQREATLGELRKEAE